jgi:hypothetical protein
MPALGLPGAAPVRNQRVLGTRHLATRLQLRRQLGPDWGPNQRYLSRLPGDLKGWKKRRGNVKVWKEMLAALRLGPRLKICRHTGLDLEIGPHRPVVAVLVFGAEVVGPG